MAELDLEYKFNRDRNKITLYDQRIVTTSIYYNAFMQETVLESGSIETIKLLSGAATESTVALMDKYFEKHPGVTDKVERLKTVALMYQAFGYGLLKLDNVSEEGGVAKIVHSNVVELLKTKFDKKDNEVCHYTNGFILGGVSSVYQKSYGFYKIGEIHGYKNYGYKINIEVA